MDAFEVVVGAGCFRSDDSRAVRFPDRWTPEGVTVESDFTGAHLLHLAAAGCVLNDVYREAVALGIPVEGVRVIASGGFDTEGGHRPASRTTSRCAHPRRPRSLPGC